MPERCELPGERKDLADRYDQDPVLAMRGVGKELWAREDGDTFIRRMRGECADPFSDGSGVGPIQTAPL